MSEEKERIVDGRRSSDATTISVPEEFLDMFNRDPNDMNAHVKTQFADVIGEPDGAYSQDCIWQNAFRCFQTGKGCCYKLVTLLCAIPLAFLWGCQFACITFTHIWMVSPCFRVFDINCECFKRFWGTCISCLCDPIHLSMALFLSKIHVTHTKEDS